MPGLGGISALLEDRVPGRAEQRIVVEEEEMRVEDGRAVLPGARRDRVPGGADPGPHLVERSCQRLPLGLWILR